MNNTSQNTDILCCPTDKSEVRSLYNQAFPDNPRWNEWFFDKVLRNDDILALYDNGRAVSTLILQPYTFGFHGSDLTLGYISGVATYAGERHNGHMRRLMDNTLVEAYKRGMAFAAVIPASERLYFFYDKFGFATTIFLDIERYTDVHIFTNAGFEAVTPDFDLLHTLETQRDCSVRHTREQFRNLVTDIKMDGGVVCAAADPVNPENCAIAFAAPSHEVGIIEVREILATSESALEAVLSQVTKLLPKLPLAVWRLPGERRAALRSRGMMRIVNVEKVFRALVAHGVDNEQVIRVHDRLIPENNGVFILKGHTLKRVDSTMRNLTLDVDIATLTTILFSSEKIGNIFNLPTSRAMLPLMLD